MENNIIELKPFIEMGAEKLREEILMMVWNADEEYLKAIHTLMFRKHQEEKEDFWGDLDDEQRKQVMSDIEQSEKDIAEGRVHTIEEVR